MNSPSLQLRKVIVGLRASVELVRPLNLMLAAVGVYVGAVLASGWETVLGSPTAVVIAMLSACAIGAAANAENDARDIAIDRINRPKRPLPSGRLGKRTAHGVAFALSVVGIALSLFLSVANAAIAVACVMTVYAYSLRLKPIGLIGNLVVSLVVATTLIYGALATGHVGLSWVGFIAAFALTLAREITKDLEDMEGDLAGETNSLPIAIGPSVARFTVAVLIAATIIAAPWPFMLLGFSGMYLAFVALSCILLLWTFGLVTSRSPTVDRYTQASALLKAAMIAGMVGLALS